MSLAKKDLAFSQYRTTYAKVSLIITEEANPPWGNLKLLIRYLPG